MILDDLVTGFPIPWLSPSLKSNCFDNGNNYVVDRLSLLWSAILLGAEALSSGSFKKISLHPDQSSHWTFVLL
jgi:hypothetical protein